MCICLHCYLSSLSFCQFPSFCNVSFPESVPQMMLSSDSHSWDVMFSTSISGELVWIRVLFSLCYSIVDLEDVVSGHTDLVVVRRIKTHLGLRTENAHVIHVHLKHTTVKLSLYHQKGNIVVYIRNTACSSPHLHQIV